MDGIGRVGLAMIVTTLITAACASGRAPAGGANNDVFDGSDEPILVVTQVCYSHCSPFQSFPGLALYGDGTLVHIEQDDAWVLQTTSRTLTPEVLDRVASLMLEAHLDAGGVRATATNYGIMDGGGTVFEAFIGGRSTYVHAPYLGSEPRDDERLTLVQLVRELQNAAAQPGVALDPAWVLIGEESAGQDAVDWKLSEAPQGDPPCMPIDPASLPVDLELDLRRDGFDAALLRFGDRVLLMSSRPLMPHETGCEDARSMLNRFSANDAGLDLGGAG